MEYTQQTGELQKTKEVFSYWKIVLVLLIILLGIVSYLFLIKSKQSPKSFVAQTEYQAVFLDNGQVYFGKIKSIDEKYLTLDDVYYIQSGEAKQNTIALIKLGNELHGPTNQMFISNAHVLFYENLSDESKVLQSIKSTK